MQNPITTPRAFFERVVVPDMEDVKRSPDDVRLAFHASTSLHQLREWVFKGGVVPGVAWNKYCEDLYARCPALAKVRDLASNAKHYPADPGRAETLDIGVSAIPAMTASGIGGAAVEFQPGQKWVIAKSGAGQGAWVLPVLLTAFEWWKQEFETHGW